MQRRSSKSFPSHLQKSPGVQIYHYVQEAHPCRSQSPKTAKPLRFPQQEAGAVFCAMHRNPSPPGGGEGRRAMRQGRDLEDYYAQLEERLRMLSLYFCRAVRVDCPASLYKETDYDLSCNDRTLRRDHGLRKACAVYQYPHQERYCPGRSVCLRCPA